MKFRLVKLGCIFVVLFLFAACSSTQKTAGHGVMSATTQNVVRIACADALHDANFSDLKGHNVNMFFTGFMEPEVKGFIEHKFRSKVENEGARVTSDQSADILMEVVIHNAGIDLGTSRVPIVSRSERTQGAVDAEIICRDKDGNRIAHQRIRGESKFEQTKVLGIQGSGTYYVKESGRWSTVRDPINYD